jgi:hypothetical protein
VRGTNLQRAERDLERAKREYDDAEQNMTDGWRRNLPTHEQAELVAIKNRAWTYRENVLQRLKTAASRAAE